MHSPSNRVEARVALPPPWPTRQILLRGRAKVRLGKPLLESKLPSSLRRRKAKSGSTKDLRHVPSSLRRVEGVRSSVSHDAASPVSPATVQNTRRHSAESSARLPSGITLAVSRRRRRGPKTNRSVRPRALPSIQIRTRMLFFQLPVFSITSSVRFHLLQGLPAGAPHLARQPRRSELLARPVHLEVAADAAENLPIE